MRAQTCRSELSKQNDRAATQCKHQASILVCLCVSELGRCDEQLSGYPGHCWSLKNNVSWNVKRTDPHYCVWHMGSYSSVHLYNHNSKGCIHLCEGFSIIGWELRVKLLNNNSKNTDCGRVVQRLALLALSKNVLGWPCMGSNPEHASFSGWSLYVLPFPTLWFSPTIKKCRSGWSIGGTTNCRDNKDPFLAS